MANKQGLKELFGYNLARIRKNAGLSQLGLAHKVGLSHNFINDIESSKKGVSFTTIERLAEALDIDPLHFFVNAALGENKDRLHYMSLIGELKKNMNEMFDKYGEMVR